MIEARNPYRLEQIYPDGNAVWLPMAVGAFFPLGYLTETVATNLWFVFNLALYGLLVWLSMVRRPPPPITLGLTIVFVLVYPPFVSHMLLGQYSILAGLLMLLAARDRMSPFAAGAMIALAAGKPQLVVLVAPGLALHYLRQGRVPLLKYIAGGAVTTALLTIPLWIAAPDWIDGYLHAMSRNYLWAHPSPYTLLRMTFFDAGLVAWIVLAVLLFAGNLWIWWRLDAKVAVRWSMALTLLVVPYIWSWDFVLLVPLLVYLLFTLRSVPAKLLLSLGYVGVWSYMVYIRLTTENDDVRYWWVPVSLVAVMAVCIWIDSRVRRRRAAISGA
jgi:hypothetical protein